MAEKRLFIGSPIPTGVKQQMQIFIDQHRHIEGLRWIPLENLHITVCFLGNVPEETLANLQEMIKVGLKSFSPHILSFKCYCFGPNSRKPRMIWTRWEKHEDFKNMTTGLYRLYDQLVQYQQYRKSPIPHATLARIKDNNHLSEIDFSQSIKPEQLCLPIDKLILWESQLTPGGVTYIPLSQFDLLYS